MTFLIENKRTEKKFEKNNENYKTTDPRYLSNPKHKKHEIFIKA
jgi:hypothetical protein